MKVGKPFLPMDPVLIDEIFDDSDWAYQVKWDGVRIVAHVSGDEVRLFNKRQNERTRQYPEMLSIVKGAVNGREAILDGEMIALRHGKPSFYDVIRRDWASSAKSINALIKEVPVSYMLFDIIYLDGEDLRALPWEERQERLLAAVRQHDRLVITDTIFGEGTALFQGVADQGLEGVVAKQRRSWYIAGGKNKLWRKAKVWQEINCVIGGYTLSGNELAAFLVGGYVTGRLTYWGKVNAAFKQEEKDRVKGYLRQLAVPDCPFVRPPRPGGRVKINWVKPELVITVQFLEWTDDLKLRHPRILGFSTASPGECTLHS
ncbi:MAG: DNA ligase [Thermoanaerobacteraceae bacterium]|nr:DNA ligase [Thermoanaerobacteraceae bacterium]